MHKRLQKKPENLPSLTMPWQNKQHRLQDFLICFITGFPYVFRVVEHATVKYTIDYKTSIFVRDVDHAMVK